MEESGFRGGGDLSAPWLRHSGRDDGGMMAPSVEMTVGVVATPVGMTVGWWPLRL